MSPFISLTSRALPLIRDNIDTDAIIPSREMTGTGKTGLAEGLFAGWRYKSVGSREIDPAFVLNDPAYRDAAILLGGANFGCGSSREHAAWALAEYGFRAVIAPSFNPIFRGNCVRNGIVPIELDPCEFMADGSDSSSEVAIDLPSQTVVFRGTIHHFEIDTEAKLMLIGGLDTIALTLERAHEITAFRAADATQRPWAHLGNASAAKL